MIRRENDWIVFSAIGVVMVNLGIGIVNTTLHHEHAILSMYVLGLLIAQYRKSQLFEDLIRWLSIHNHIWLNKYKVQ